LAPKPKGNGKKPIASSDFGTRFTQALSDALGYPENHPENRIG
jgi:hypothetical protein